MYPLPRVVNAMVRALVVLALTFTVRATAQDAPSLVSAARLAALPEPSRSEWRSYVERSDRARAEDQALLTRELRALQRSEMTRAPYAATSFTYDAPRDAAWLTSDSGRAVIASVLSFQTPSGGWSKHVEYTQGVRRSGQSFFSENTKWQYIATIDNGATTSQLRLLLHAARLRPDSALRAAIERGVRYLIMAQFPTGCWPQVWPLQGSYHDAATFNDDATINVLSVLDAVALESVASHPTPIMPSAITNAANAAVSRGIGCLLDAQVIVNGARSVWGQQHDPISLAPTSARSYELTSLVSKESAGIMDFLLAHVARDTRIPEALAGAAAWLDRTAIRGKRQDGKNGLVNDATASVLWARMYEIGTNRPVFSNRDGIKLYEFDLLTDRREGYGWYSDQPAGALRRYRRWLSGRASPASGVR